MITMFDFTTMIIAGLTFTLVGSMWTALNTANRAQYAAKAPTSITDRYNLRESQKQTWVAWTILIIGLLLDAGAILNALPRKGMLMMGFMSIVSLACFVVGLLWLTINTSNLKHYSSEIARLEPLAKIESKHTDAYGTELYETRIKLANSIRVRSVPSGMVLVSIVLAARLLFDIFT